MNAIEHLADRHPILTGLTGTLGSAFTWWLQNLEQLNAVLRFFTGLLAVLAGAFTVALLAWRWKHRVRLSERRRHFQHDPDDDISD